MEKLLEILNKYEVEAHEVAEMIWAYLDAYGEEEDDVALIIELEKSFLSQL